MRNLKGITVLALALSWLGPRTSASCPLTALDDDGTSTPNARAPIAKFVYERGVYLIRPSEMAGSGIVSGAISGIGWSYATAPGLVGTAPLKIYLQNTADTTNTKSTIWATAISGMTLAHDTTTTLPNVVGSFDIPFSGGSAFNYTGGGLYVAFDWGPYTGPQSTTVAVLTNMLLTNGFIGQTSPVTPPATLSLASNFRAATRLAGVTPATDVTIEHVIAMGAVPLGLVGPQTIQATVFQIGDTDLTDVPVTLSISGSEPSTETVTLPSLLKCGTGGVLITFDPFAPTLTGSDLLTVSAPADAVPVNDTLARQLDVTVNQWSFEHAGTPPDAGLGFASPGQLTARFDAPATQIDAIMVNFQAVSATKYRLEIRADDGTGKPGALKYLDAADRSVLATGKQTIVLPSPVAISGSTYVGVRQMNTTNLSYSVNDEYPVRPGTFFYNSTPGSTAWVDFGAGGVFSQLNIGVIVGPCLAPLSVNVTPEMASACVGSNVVLTASASGTAPYTYRWSEDGVDIPGATSSSYSATKAAAGSHTYNCRVTDAGGCAAVVDGAATTATWVAAVPPPETAAGPGAANQLVWSTPESLVWPVNSDAASYTLYRGVRADLPKLADATVDSCTRYQGTAATATGLTELLPPGDFYWYVVTATTVCGIEGSAGGTRVVNSSGVCP
jgi:hypothetical protein